MHSHLPYSIRTKGRTDNARIIDDQARSVSRNAFRRLGKGADMRDMLNRRREQESSQHSTAQRRQQEVNSQGIQNIPIEDMRCARVSMEEQDDELVVKAVGSPFCKEIRTTLLPEGFKLPTIKVYEGNSDPQDHLDHFNDLMELHMVSNNAKCKAFTVTLSNGAKKWFRWMTPRSVTSWQQLSTFFLWQFQMTKQFVVQLAHLGNVKQKKGGIQWLIL